VVGQTFWKNISGKHFGQTFRANISGKHFGQTFRAMCVSQRQLCHVRFSTQTLPCAFLNAKFCFGRISATGHAEMHPLRAFHQCCDAPPSAPGALHLSVDPGRKDNEFPPCVSSVLRCTPCVSSVLRCTPCVSSVLRSTLTSATTIGLGCTNILYKHFCHWPLATGHWSLATLLRFISAEMHPLRLISAEMHPYRRHYDRVGLYKYFVQKFLPLATGHWSLATDLSGPTTRQRWLRTIAARNLAHFLDHFSAQDFRGDSAQLLRAIWRIVATGHWSLVTGHWPLATGYWPLTTGHWPLATGHWPLATLFPFD
jgi:hypothetical protein